MKKNKDGLFLIISLIIIIILVLLFPVIYKNIEKSNLPKIENNSKKENKKDLTVDEETLNSVHFPLMRNGEYSIDTYYSLDKFTPQNLSNNDILYRAFLEVYEGNMVPYNSWVKCTRESKQINEEYISLRIKNILGKNINYVLEDFNVYEGSNTNYVGLWKYDSINKIFIYNGLCKSTSNNIKYYDLEQLIKAEYEDDSLVVYYYVGFAKVENNNYIIYSDSLMQNEIKSGTITNVDELNQIFEQIDNNNKKTYKYVFKNNLCTYNDYCLYEGKWINEL